jgi:hypothetical protein
MDGRSGGNCPRFCPILSSFIRAGSKANTDTLKGYPTSGIILRPGLSYVRGYPTFGVILRPGFIPRPGLSYVRGYPTSGVELVHRSRT